MVRVLVVDDEPGYRESIAYFLKHEGHDVLAFSTLQDAIAGAAAFPPDILIADWVLSDRRTGAELARQLVGMFPLLQIILITGLPPKMVLDQSADLNIARLIEKPFEPQELVQAVHDAVHRSDAEHGPVGS